MALYKKYKWLLFTSLIVVSIGLVYIFLTLFFSLGMLPGPPKDGYQELIKNLVILFKIKEVFILLIPFCLVILFFGLNRLLSLQR